MIVRVRRHPAWPEFMYDPPVDLPVPKIVNLITDLKEERDVGVKAGWVSVPIVKMLTEWQASLKKYPPIKMGTPDPYVPPK